MSEVAESPAWTEVLGEGRLPRFVLICLAVWLNAADSLVTATIMPSVGRALGGYAYFGWATSGYLMGSVLPAQVLACLHYGSAYARGRWWLPWSIPAAAS